MSTGTWNGSGAARENKAPPPSIRCKVGGEWLPPTSFSKNQLSKWNRNGNGIVCRDHSGENSTLLKCEGPCGLWKSKDKFSSAQKRNNLNWCTGCVRWREQQDYDTIPAPAPNEKNVAIDEYEGSAAKRFQVETKKDLPDDESTDSEDSDAEIPGAGRTGHYFPTEGEEIAANEEDNAVHSDNDEVRITLTSSVAYRDTKQKVSQTRQREAGRSTSDKRSPAAAALSSPWSRPGQSSGQSISSAASWVPEHLLLKQNLRVLEKGGVIDRHVAPASSPSASTARDESEVPPHLRKVVHRNQPSTTRESGIALSKSDESTSRASSQGRSSAKFSRNAYGNPASVSTSTYQQGPSRDQFRAYDPDGNLHMRAYNRSEFSRHVTAEDARKSSEDRRKGSSNGWARPDRRKIFNATSLDTRRPGVDGIEIEEEDESQDEF